MSSNIDTNVLLLPSIVQTAQNRKKLRLQRLREDIDKEREAILCLEAQLACLRSPKLRRQLPFSALGDQSQTNVGHEQRCMNDNDGKKATSEDLLDLLDTLGGQFNDTTSTSIQEFLDQNIEPNEVSRNESTGNSYHLLPFATGIYFTHVSQPKIWEKFSVCSQFDPIVENTHRSLYELKGGVLPEIGALHFCMSVLASAGMTAGSHKAKSIASKETIQIDQIVMKFERPPESMMIELERYIDQHKGYSHECITAFCKEELDDFAAVVGMSRDLPKIFRSIVTYAEFDRHRIKTLLELQKTYSKKARFSILSPNKVRISLFTADEKHQSHEERQGLPEEGSHLGDIDVAWKWRFSLLGSCGAEDLTIESINIVRDSSSDRQSAAYAILNDLKDRGLYFILSSLGGDCAKALKLLLKISSV
jgi:hypothetical protein